MRIRVTLSSGQRPTLGRLLYPGMIGGYWRIGRLDKIHLNHPRKPCTTGHITHTQAQVVPIPFNNGSVSDCT
jgi:hypothetical protein